MKTLFIQIPTRPRTIVAARTHNDITRFPSEKLSPTYVEEITEGIRENVHIKRNRRGAIPVQGAKYVSRSFGVPGIA